MADALNSDNLAFPEEEKDSANLNEVNLSAMIGIIQKRFQEATFARRLHEERMIQAYNNFRGLYDKEVRFRESEKSRIFVKATKTKVLAGFGQVIEIVLNEEKFPIGVSSTDMPEGTEDIVHVEPQNSPTEDIENDASPTSPFDVGFAGDDRVLPPGATFGTKLKRLIGIESSPEEEVLSPGPSPTGQGAQMSPAGEAAYKMDKLIQDQLQESDAPSEVANAIFECVMLGTGIVKGPFTFVKTLHKWVKEGDKRIYKPIHVKVPRIEFVSVWDAYPDPNATNKKELSYFIHRHRMSESQLRALSRMPHFKEDRIATCIINGPNYEKQIYEDFVISSSLEENGSRQFEDRYEVLEYWGTMGVAEAREMGLSVDSAISNLEEIQINAWLCGNQLLRLVSNPFTPSRIPYHIFNYEVNPYSIFGIGIPENMSDSQAMMNGHARMAADNLQLAGGLVFDIDETMLVPGQDSKIFNGKIFWRQGGSAGQAVHGIKFPNTAVENLQMFDKFRQIADEETGIPSFSHGQLGVTGMTRTASGMSMLMGAASLNIKTVIKNLDKQLFRPLGEDSFQWNMQFYEGDIDVEGDLEIKALGMNSMMQKEVRSQRLTLFLQTVMNPAIAPLVKIPYIVEELAKSLDLDKDKILNTTQEARVQAEIIGLQNNGQQVSQEIAATGQQPGGAGAPAGVLQGGGNTGPTGNGNGTIGTGVVANAGEVEFPANTG